MTQTVASILFILEAVLVIAVIVWVLLKLKSIADSLKKIEEHICREEIRKPVSAPEDKCVE